MTRELIIEPTTLGVVRAHLTQGEIQVRLTLGVIPACMNLGAVEERSTLGVIQEQGPWNLCVIQKCSIHDVVQLRKINYEVQEHLT